MSKIDTISLGSYFDDYVEQQIKTGRFSSAGEVVRSALRLFADRENKKEVLIDELKRGEESGFQEDFSRNKFLNEIHEKQSAS